MATAFLGLPTVTAGTLIKASDWNSMVNKIDAAIKKIMVVEKLQKSLWLYNTAIYHTSVSNPLTKTTITVPRDYSYFKVYSYATRGRIESPTVGSATAVTVTDLHLEPSKIVKLSVNSSQDILILRELNHTEVMDYSYENIRFTQTNATTIALNQTTGHDTVLHIDLYLEFYKYEAVSV